MTVRVITGEARTTIRRPVSVVFDWLTDPALLTQWVGGLVESRSEGPAEVRIGARSVEKISVRGKSILMPSEIVELEDDHVIATRIETSDGPCLSRFVLEDRGDACGLVQTLTAEMTGQRWIPAFVIASAITRKLKRDLARLTQRAEATH